MIHLFASDYDGTLFKDHTIRESDLEAIRKFRALGHKFGIVTGRSINSIRTEIDKHDIPVDFVVGINGGVVLDHDYNELFASKMDNEVADDIVNLVHDFGVEFYGTNDGYRVSREMGDGVNTIFETNVEPTDPEEIKKAGIAAMYIWSGSHESAQKLSATINDRFGRYGIHSYPNTSAVDVGVKDVSKSTGIEMIRNHYGYNGNVYAIGDSYNDVPMIRDFHGFLMDNGEMELEHLAKGGLSNTVGDALTNIMNSL